MRSLNLFLLLYLVGSCFEPSNAESDDTCAARDTCSVEEDSTSDFFQCVGLPSTDNGTEHMRNLKDLLEATMDLYTFMKTTMTRVPIVILDVGMELDPFADPLQNEALVQMWLDVKIIPLLKSITKQFLTCLSTKTFSCATYQTIVRELSIYYSHMDDNKRRWIYTFFMYPFLSGDRVEGCVAPEESSEEWLIKNFGAFAVMARFKDLCTLNVVFSGLEVLRLLSPAQKAELMMMPGFYSWDQGNMTVVLNSLLMGSSGPPSNSSHEPPPPPPYPIQPMPTGPSLSQVAGEFMMAIRPVGRLIQDFVFLTQKGNVSEIRSTTLTQMVLNWTLSEMATMYQPQDPVDVPEMPHFNMTDVEDWYQQVIVPQLQSLFPYCGDLMNENLKYGFQSAFYLEHAMDNETEILDVCSVTLDKSPCGLTNVVEKVAYILHCAAQSNLILSEETILKMIDQLVIRLNSLLVESMANFADLAHEFQEIFSEGDVPSLHHENLQNPEYIELWFKIKLLPLLPDVPSDLLSCLSTKNFSCPAYHALVAALSKEMQMMNADPMYSESIYENFIKSFLWHRRNDTDSDPCLSSAANSTDWLMRNFAFFSQFAIVTDFYSLNPDFSGLEVLHLFTPKQLAEMMLLPLPVPPGKDVVIDKVFDHLLEFPHKVPETLHYVTELSEKIDVPCNIYNQIFEQTYSAIPSLPMEMESVIWSSIDEMMSIAPRECVPKNITCPVVSFNATHICGGVNSSDLQAHLSTMYVTVPCSHTLEEYACANLENFTAGHLASLLQCNLPGNTNNSKILWKMLFTKVSGVLNPALDMLAAKPLPVMVPSATAVLDVILEMRLSQLTEAQLMDSSVITQWFSRRLGPLLPSVSAHFLSCFIQSKNLSCQAYQQILQVFIHQFDDLSSDQKDVVLHNFILPFLSQPHTGPGCVNGSNTSTEWLMKNLGMFSTLLPMGEILGLNPRFDPLEVVPYLTPMQSAELLALPLPANPEKEVIINVLFDHLTEPPQQHELPKFLYHLLMIIPQANLSCSSFITLFTRLDLAAAEVPLAIASHITKSKTTLFGHVPPGCTIYRGNCSVTTVNETALCAGVNSTALQHLLDTGSLSGNLCTFTVGEFACASLSGLTAQELADIMMCSRSTGHSGSLQLWKLLLQKALIQLDPALDLLATKTLDPMNPALPMILDAIRETRLDLVDSTRFSDPVFIEVWFNRRLRPFLPAVSADFLTCVVTKGFNCSSYQHIVQILTQSQPKMTLATEMLIATRFIAVFLTRKSTADPSCTSGSVNSSVWVHKNFGAFSHVFSIQELEMLNPDFSPMGALEVLTEMQVVEFASTPGELTSAEQVTMVMNHVPNEQLGDFFDNFSPAVTDSEHMFPPEVMPAMLQVVFDHADLTNPSVSDAEMSEWLETRLTPLLVNLSPNHVGPFFAILAGRNCSTQHLGVEVLDSTMGSLSEETKKEIHNHIVQQLNEGPAPLHCYSANVNQSFYVFLEGTFMGFQFPNVSTFLSLMRPDNMHQLVNSMPPSDLGDLLNRPGAVDDEVKLCELYKSYEQTQQFLADERLPEELGRPTMACVWPIALQSSERPQVQAWFEESLPGYFLFLDKEMIGPGVTHSASCLSFQQFVLILGKHDYGASDFNRTDVYESIKDYLTVNQSSGTVTPRCYSTSDPELNSTAWFALYIGSFFGYVSREDLHSFGSEQVLQQFSVNSQNIALLNDTGVSQDLVSAYVQLVYQQDSNFDPLQLPTSGQCDAPGQAFAQLDKDETLTLLPSLTSSCPDLDPQVSAALAHNLGDSINSEAIGALGNESSGMSAGQLMVITPTVLNESLSTLSTVSWSQSQANVIVLSLVSAGVIQINDTTTLIMLGTLVVGIPASVMSNISGSQLINASHHAEFLGHVMLAPAVVQEVFVHQIILVSNSSDSVIGNVPEEMATEIPRPVLLGISDDGEVIKEINDKEWTADQSELFFSTVAGESGVAVLGGQNNLSVSVLQGFTCTSVRNFKKTHVRNLVKACRRKNNEKRRKKKKEKVTLVESQLTCMYFFIKGETDVTNFQLYPRDVLLYYDYSLVPTNSCMSYFLEVGQADVAVVSPNLRYKVQDLIANFRNCLGAANTSLTKDTITVMGNLVCSLDVIYIQNSDPYILEKLKNCRYLSDELANAMESRLLSGASHYGEPSTWDCDILMKLGYFPLYAGVKFFAEFDNKCKRTFLVQYQKYLGKDISRKERKHMKRAIRNSMKKKRRRSITGECTSGNITVVTISDDSFPFDYYEEPLQFTYCLSAATVKDNLGAITSKVDDEDFLRPVLSKLHEAYASRSSIPEEQVQFLGTAARVATEAQLNNWTITRVDTLAALMNPVEGEWDGNLVQIIVAKYLSKDGNTLGSSELNAITGPNLCVLPIDVLGNIIPESLKDADVLVLTNCTLEKQKVLFKIARGAFARTARQAVSVPTFQLIKPFMGGADEAYVKGLVGSNVNMDMETFTKMDVAVIMSLSVDQVKSILGSHVDQLKSYENQTVVNSWITRQLQSNLDTLGLQLTGGRADPTTGPVTTTPAGQTSAGGTTPTTAGTAAGTAAGTVAGTAAGTVAGTVAGTAAGTVAGTVAGTAAGTTAGSPTGARADIHVSLFVLFLLFITSQHIAL